MDVAEPAPARFQRSREQFLRLGVLCLAREGRGHWQISLSTRLIEHTKPLSVDPLASVFFPWRESDCVKLPAVIVMSTFSSDFQ
jgi:hypothetical protein